MLDSFFVRLRLKNPLTLSNNQTTPTRAPTPARPAVTIPCRFQEFGRNILCRCNNRRERFCVVDRGFSYYHWNTFDFRRLNIDWSERTAEPPKAEQRVTLHLAILNGKRILGTSRRTKFGIVNTQISIENCGWIRNTRRLNFVLFRLFITLLIGRGIRSNQISLISEEVNRIAISSCGVRIALT